MDNSSIENRLKKFYYYLGKKIVNNESRDSQFEVLSKDENVVLYEENFRIESAIYGKHKLYVGAHSYMGNSGYIKGDVFIGRFVSIGRRVSIGAGAHPIHFLSTSPVLNKNGRRYTAEELTDLKVKRDPYSGITKPTTILNDVWIGDGAVIMPGVVVGNGAVIAANSVVTTNVPPYAIYGGIPARKIDYRFQSDVVLRIQDSRWWNASVVDLHSCSPRHILDFLYNFECLSKEQRKVYDYKLLRK